MGPSLGQIKSAEELSMKMSSHKIRHFMDLKNTSARGLRTMTPGKEGSLSVASLSTVLKRMK